MKYNILKWLFGDWIKFFYEQLIWVMNLPEYLINMFTVAHLLPNCNFELAHNIWNGFKPSFLSLIADLVFLQT